MLEADADLRRRLPVGDGHEIEVFEAGASGPVLAILAGVHGDEDEGILAARRLLTELRDAELTGRVRVVPIANPMAREAGRRTTPDDDLNLARVFPGSPHGSITRRIAHALTTEVIAGAQLLVDLHSGGRSYDMPLYCGYRVTTPEVSARARAAARAFGTPLVWAHDRGAPGRSLSVAAALGIPAIYAECRGGGMVRARYVDAFADGLRNVARYLGVLPGPCVPTHARLIVGSGGDVDAGIPAGVRGMLARRVEPGALVAAGDTLAEIVDEATGSAVEAIAAPHDGIVMLVRRDARVEPGDTVALLAPPSRAWGEPT